MTLPTPEEPSQNRDEAPLHILIADDDPDILVSGRFLFEDAGWSVVEARSPAEVLRLLDEKDVDIALVDMNYERNTTGGQEGLDLIGKIRKTEPDLPVLVMTAWGTIDLAINAMKMGASDFVQKPWDNVQLLQQLRTHVKAFRATRRNHLLEDENRVLREAASAAPGFVCQCEAMRRVMDIVEQVAPSRANILLLGENGTGKGVLAKIIHERSGLGGCPFISVNVGGLPESLFESEMFGHVKGAFTDAKSDRAGRIEMAQNGTLFLDEIGNITPAQQSRLLRLLETGEYERVGSSRTMKANARILSATNADLRSEVQNGSFREDLFFRLNTVTIVLPPLRERREDILPLARHFLKIHAEKYRKKISGFETGTAEALLAHNWPGNIRELNHAIERAVLLCRGGAICLRDLGIETSRDSGQDIDSMSIEEMEQFLIQKALARNDGNVSKAAGQLGMSRATFYRRLKDLEK